MKDQPVQQRHNVLGNLLSFIETMKFTVPVLPTLNPTTHSIPYSGTGRSRTFKRNLRAIKKHQRYRLHQRLLRR